MREKVLTLIFGALAFPLNALQVYLTYIRKPSFIGSSIFEYWCNYNHVWLGIFLFLFLMVLFRNISWGEKSKVFLTFTDKYSYETYLIHQFFILGPMSLMSITGILSVNILIIYGCIIAGAFVLNKIESVVPV